MYGKYEMDICIFVSSCWQHVATFKSNILSAIENHQFFEKNENNILAMLEIFCQDAYLKIF